MRRIEERDSVGGVDTHRDTHVAVVIDHVGGVFGTAFFSADAALLPAVVLDGSARPHREVGVEGAESSTRRRPRHRPAEDSALAVVSTGVYDGVCLERLST